MWLEQYIQDLFFYSSSISLVLFIWFKSDAFIEYCSLFGFKKLFYIKDFNEQKSINPALTYPDYLVIYRDNFFSRLLSCPTCASVWLGVLFYFCHTQFTLLICSIVLGLIVYLLLCVLERKAYD